MPRGMTVKNRIGEKVGRLEVVKRVANRVEKNSIRACWLCRCSCGNEIILTGHTLSKAMNNTGGTRSCGCLAKEKPIKHGMCGKPVYKSWHMMLQRCTNKNNAAYKSYGARGISVCEEWRDFTKFLADMGNPDKGMTIDRIDVNGNYCKENCKWSTMKEQSNNRRTNVFITYKGEKKTLAEWADFTNLGKACLSNRLNSGWTIERALNELKN